MHDLMIKRSTNERSFSRSYMQLQKLLLDSNTLSNTIERHLQTITQQWNLIQECHDLYAVTCLNDEAEIATHDLWIDSYFSKFAEITAQCDKFLLRKTADSSSTTATNVIKLEKLKFRKFDGDSRKYLRFKDEFNKFIRPLCDDSQVSFVLKAHLCESVVREIEHLDHDIDLIWKRLDAKYGTLRKVIDSILKDLKSLSTNSAMNSLQLIKLVESAYYDLDSVSALDEMMNSTVLSAIERAMSIEMREEWIKLASKEIDSRSKDLMPFLNDWRCRLEYEESEIRTECSHVLSTMSPESEQTRTCLIHQECHHPVWRCRVFQSLPVQRRIEIVKAANACTLCLEKGHEMENCHKTFTCSIGSCVAKHNRLLHRP